MNSIQECIAEYETPKRTPLSKKFPSLLGLIVLARRTNRTIVNYFKFGIGLKKSSGFYKCVLARHSSPLFRKLGQSDMRLQFNKVQNLKVAVAKINGLIIPPGKTFSFWHEIGLANEKRGFVNGMVLQNGEVKEGVGGGLCQLSNFLFWIFLHADTTIMERHHHSFDVFPDSDRTLPFGSGATVYCNYIDLQMRNISDSHIQIKIWLTDKCLKGQLVSDKGSTKKFHVREEGRCLVKKGAQYFRFNELWRDTFVSGQKVKQEKIATNFARVAYEIPSENFLSGKYILTELSHFEDQKLEIAK